MAILGSICCSHGLSSESHHAHDHSGVGRVRHMLGILWVIKVSTAPYTRLTPSTFLFNNGLLLQTLLEKNKKNTKKSLPSFLVCYLLSCFIFLFYHMWVLFLWLYCVPSSPLALPLWLCLVINASFMPLWLCCVINVSSMPTMAVSSPLVSFPATVVSSPIPSQEYKQYNEASQWFA